MIRDIARIVAIGGIFILPFLPLVVMNSLFFPFITGKNFAFRIVVEIVFAAWIILACYDPKYRPRFSYILVGLLSLLGVMAIANALGVSPHKSFWSNFERMDGYVTLVHLGMYFMVAGVVLTREKLWNWFWNVSLGVATLMMLYGFCQLGGSSSCPISQSDVRIDGRMGNAAYLAIYMLFHIFISLLMLARARERWMQVVYGVLAVGFVFTLIQTGTRGTTLALFGGAFLSAAYIAIFERANLRIRQMAIAAVLGVVVLAGVLYVAKDADLIASNDILRRLSSVSLEEGSTRFTIWGIAWEGVKERPLLGWGQENFNYVFNEHYTAALYAQEPWFDRVHNIVFDWLIAGGILGFLAYALTVGASFYYVLACSTKELEGGSFSVAERGLLFGLLGGYVAHNLLVFDNLISYLFFVSVIAMIHGRCAYPIPALANLRIPEVHITNIITPIVVVALCLTLYVVNVPGLQAAGDLIKAFVQPSPAERLTIVERALSRDSFGNQEVREQLGRLTQSLLQDTTLPEHIRNANPGMSLEEAEKEANQLRLSYGRLAEEEFKKQVMETPHDVRILIFQSALYRALGNPDEAIRILTEAIALSPEKQQSYFELGFAYIQKNDLATAQEVFKKAYELEERSEMARMFYAGSLLAGGDRKGFDALTPSAYEGYLTSDFILRAAYDTGAFDIVIDILEKRIQHHPLNLQVRTSLALAYFQSGDIKNAVRVIEEAIVAFPEFKPQGEEFIRQITGGILSVR